MRSVLGGVTLALLLAGCGDAAQQPASGEQGGPSADVSADPPLDAGGESGMARALPAGAAPASTGGALPRGVWRVQPVDIVDGRGFERPLVAYRAMVPAGWRAQGGIVWNVGNPCANGDYALQWTITAPDGVSVLAMVPQPVWRILRTSMPRQRGSCEGPQWTDVQQYLEGLARQNFPEGRIIEYRPRPDIARPVVEMLRQSPPMQTELMQARMRAEGGEIVIATRFAGRETRELIRALVMINETRLADIMNPGQIALEGLDGVPLAVTFMRAPVESFDPRLPDLIERSMLRMAEWSNRVYEHNRRKQQAAFEATIRAGVSSQQQLQQMNAAHQSRMQALDAGRQFNDRLYDLRNASSDRQQREFVESIRGVETYHEPVAGGVVQLDNTYQHAWRVQDGSYLLTDDPNFRPGLIGLEGQELRRVQ